MKILKSILYKTEPISVSEVARDLRISKGLVSKFFDILTKENILKKTNNTFQVQGRLRTRMLKIVLNLDEFDRDIFKKYKFVHGAGLYGSLVKGENTDESDVDLWILVDEADEKALAKLTNELKKRYGNIKTLYLTREKLQTLRTEDTVFYHFLVFGSLVIFGEELETI